jgi:hypothetical protein
MGEFFHASLVPKSWRELRSRIKAELQGQQDAFFKAVCAFMKEEFWDSTQNIIPCFHRCRKEYLAKNPSEMTLQPGEYVCVFSHERHSLDGGVFGSTDLSGMADTFGVFPWLAVDEECLDIWDIFPRLPSSMGLQASGIDVHRCLNILRHEFQVGPVVFQNVSYGMCFTGRSLVHFFMRHGLTEQQSGLLCHHMQRGFLLQASVLSFARFNKIMEEILDEFEAKGTIDSNMSFGYVFLVVRSRMKFEYDSHPYNFFTPLGVGKLSGKVRKSRTHHVPVHSKQYIDMRSFRAYVGMGAIQHQKYLDAVRQGPLPSPLLSETPINILCFDGGGVKGYLQLLSLCKILERFPTFMDHIWGFAGVSTGSLSAAVCVQDNDLLEWGEMGMYPLLVKQVFVTRRNMMTRLGKALVESNALHNLAQAMFPESLDVLRKRVLIVSTLLDNGEEGPSRAADFAYHHNFGDKPDSRKTLGDCVIKSCSAPTYFGSYQGHCDGGLVVNSPVMPALQTLIREYGVGILSRVRILSIGTGMAPTFMGTNDQINGDEGIYEWAKKGQLGLGIIMRLAVDRDLAMAADLLGKDHVHRLNFPMEQFIDLASVEDSTFDKLEKLVTPELLEPTMEWIAKNIMKEEEGEL